MAGAAVVTRVTKDPTDRTPVRRISIAWTSDAAGVVSGVGPLPKMNGCLRQAVFVHPAGGTQPTDAYDVVLTSDVSGVDVLNGQGANIAIAAPQFKNINSYIDGEILTVGITNAGNAKQGTIHLYFSS